MTMLEQETAIFLKAALGGHTAIAIREFFSIAVTVRPSRATLRIHGLLPPIAGSRMIGIRDWGFLFL